MLMRKGTNPHFQEFADFIVLQLLHMRIREVKTITGAPEGFTTSILLYYLAKAGWYRGEHYNTRRKGQCPLTGQKISLAPNQVWVERLRLPKPEPKRAPLTGCKVYNKVTPSISEKIMKHSKSISNQAKLLKAMEINELTRKQIAEITGYSIDAIHGYCMPDRGSARACKVTDRFIQIMNLNLERQNLQTVV